MKNLIALFKDEEGASMPEYALLVALIAVVVIAGATVLGGNINSKMSATATKIGTTAP
jgi:pilus assembly protein Flp/PilA